MALCSYSNAIKIRSGNSGNFTAEELDQKGIEQIDADRAAHLATRQKWQSMRGHIGGFAGRHLFVRKNKGSQQKHYNLAA
jgi:hypothetical protein